MVIDVFLDIFIDVILDIFMDVILDIFIDVILDSFMDSWMSLLMYFYTFQCWLLTVIFEFILYLHKLKDFILPRRVVFLKTFYLCINVLIFLKKFLIKQNLIQAQFYV